MRTFIYALLLSVTAMIGGFSIRSIIKFSVLIEEMIKQPNLGGVIEAILSLGLIVAPIIVVAALVCSTVYAAQAAIERVINVVVLSWFMALPLCILFRLRSRWLVQWFLTGVEITIYAVIGLCIGIVCIIASTGLAWLVNRMRSS